MIDKLIACAVCWYETLYQILPVALANRITLVAFATRSDTGSHNRLDLIQSFVPPHYVCNWYIYSGCGRVVKGGGHKAKRLVLQCINSVSSNSSREEQR
jgi:hypothetical protein